MNPQEAFLDILIAAMTDAALEGKLTNYKQRLRLRERHSRKLYALW